MPMPVLFQALPAPSTEMHAAVEGVVFAVILGAGKAISHLRGKPARSAAARKAEEHAVKIDRISTAVDTIGGDVRDLRAFVVGPDGQNGLRGDVRGLTKRVDGIEERERARPYDRRSSV